MLTSARIPFMLAILPSGLPASLGPEDVVLGADGVELRLNLWRIAPRTAVQDFLIVGEHLLFMLLDVLNRRQHLGRRKPQLRRDQGMMHALPVIIHDVVHRNPRVLDFGSTPPVDDSVHRNSPKGKR